MDLKNQIKNRKVLFGVKQAKKTKKNKIDKIILSKDAPFEKELKNLPVERVKENNKEIGEICNKPFGISVVAIMKEKG